jgi:hypothetical protein
MAKKPTKTAKAKPGPKPDVLKIGGGWINAVDKALAKKRPADGWPKMPKR